MRKSNKKDGNQEIKRRKRERQEAGSKRRGGVREVSEISRSSNVRRGTNTDDEVR